MTGVRRKLLGIVILATIYGAPIAVAEERVSHDHQKMKTQATKPSAEAKSPGTNCESTGNESDQDVARESKAGKSEVANCRSKEKSKPRHDHREMKNI